jgi:hypothetical protein
MSNRVIVAWDRFDDLPPILVSCSQPSTMLNGLYVSGLAVEWELANSTPT